MRLGGDSPRPLRLRGILLIFKAVKHNRMNAMKEFMSDLKARLRNITDYTIYGKRLGYLNPWTVIIDAAALAYTIATLDLNGGPEERHPAILAAIILALLLWDITGLMKEFGTYFSHGKYFNIHDRHTRPCKELKPAPRLEEAYPQHTCFRHDIIIYSDKINRLLGPGPKITVRIRHSHRKHTLNYIRTFKYTLHPFLSSMWHKMNRNEGSFYNEKKLCMGSEFHIDDKGRETVYLCKGSYYDSYLTNSIYARCITHQNNYKIFAPLNPSNYRVTLLEDSKMDDHIGVSTLAISTDGKVFILHHNEKAATQPNTLTPSGSGSVDFADLKRAWKRYKKDLRKNRRKGSRESLDFRDIIITAVERELMEETLIGREDIDRTEIVGYYRDMKRGGKPEFCCVTYLTKNSIEITDKMQAEFAEHRNGIIKFRIMKTKYNGEKVLNGPDMDIFEKTVCDDTDEEYTDDTPSLALYMNYVMLCNRFGRRPKEWHCPERCTQKCPYGRMQEQSLEEAAR